MPGAMAARMRWVAPRPLHPPDISERQPHRPTLPTELAAQSVLVRSGAPRRLCCILLCFALLYFTFACWSQRVRLTGVSTASSPMRKGSPDNVTNCVILVHRKHARFPLTGGSNLCGCAFNGFYDKPLNQRMNGEQLALQYQPKDDAWAFQSITNG